MVIARVPEVAVSCDPEKCILKQRTLSQILSLPHIAVHPRFRSGLWIRFVAYIDNGKRPIRLGFPILPGLAIDFDETKMKGIGPQDDAAQRGLKEGYVDAAIDIEVFTYVVEGTGRIQSLREPNTSLRNGKRTASCIGPSHVWSVLRKRNIWKQTMEECMRTI
jgi:hypothetical protein